MANTRITYNCEWCGKEHIQDIGNYNRNEHHFCCGTCALRFRWNKHNKSKEELLEEIIECACGCGETLHKYTIDQETTLRERKFINGHSGRLGNSGNFQKGFIPWNKGIEYPEELCEKFKELNKGRKDSYETRVKKSCYQHGISIEEFVDFNSTSTQRQKEMSTHEYKSWRTAVFERDNYKCKHCGMNTKDLRAHHLKKWVEFPELRYDINNGLTLCNACHMAVHFNTKQNG